MTTDFLALNSDAKAEDAIELLRNFEGGVETVSTIYLLGEDSKLVGAVPLPNLVLATPGTPLMNLSLHPVISASAGVSEKEVAEVFDKYNLFTLPVVDEAGRLTGVITADDVISLLRAKL